MSCDDDSEVGKSRSDSLNDLADDELREKGSRSAFGQDEGYGETSLHTSALSTAPPVEERVSVKQRSEEGTAGRDATNLFGS